MKDNFKDFIGKWCLCKRTRKDTYVRLFIADVKDGIIKYSADKKNWTYEDVDNWWFNHDYTKICPFEEAESQSEQSEQDDSWYSSLPTYTCIGTP